MSNTVTNLSAVLKQQITDLLGQINCSLQRGYVFKRNVDNVKDLLLLPEPMDGDIHSVEITPRQRLWFQYIKKYDGIEYFYPDSSTGLPGAWHIVNGTAHTELDYWQSKSPYEKGELFEFTPKEACTSANGINLVPTGGYIGTYAKNPHEPHSYSSGGDLDANEVLHITVVRFVHTSDLEIGTEQMHWIKDEFEPKHHHHIRIWDRLNISSDYTL